MSGEERKRIHEQRARARGQQVNTAQTQQNNDANSTIAGGPPSTIDINQGQRSQANTQGQGTQSQAGSTQPGSIFRNMMSNATQRSAQQGTATPDTVSANGAQYRRVNMTKTLRRRFQQAMAKHTGNENVQYSVFFQADEDGEGSLLDSGANGGMAGGDVLIVEEYDMSVNVLKQDSH